VAEAGPLRCCGRTGRGNNRTRPQHFGPGAKGVQSSVGPPRAAADATGFHVFLPEHMPGHTRYT